MRRIPVVSIVLVLVAVSRLPAKDFTAERFVAGCAQIFVTGDLQKNLEKYLYFIHKADSLDVDIVVFPETSLSGYGPVHYKESPMPTADALKEALKSVRDAARETGVWVIAGTSTCRGEDLYNDIHVIDDNGEIKTTYSKVQLTGGDATFYQPGGEISTYRAGGMKFGLEI